VKQQGKTYRFLGLNAADTPESARAFLRRYGWTWPSISDPRRTLARRLGATYQPAVILIDAQGRVVGGFQDAGNPARWNALKAKLRR
jgi:hypothetical protein